jgi:enoyl-CoA hydratase/carnithine racemase
MTAAHRRVKALETGANAMAYQYVRVERDGPITTITLNRPEVMNALHSDAHFELAEVFDAFAADPEQWVGIVTGAGERAFSAGNDLKHQATGGKMGSPPSGFAGLTSRFDLNKPLIAAVNGVAMGGGFEIALACDIIIASETAVFALPEPRVGLAALAGGMHRLPRAIGLKRAMGMVLTGRRVSAKEGEALGFVNEVAAPSELLAVARRWAGLICECSPMSIRASKEAVMKGLDEPTLEAAIKGQIRYPAVAAMFTSADFVEGPMAFAQKRAPNWKGA